MSTTSRAIGNITIIQANNYFLHNNSSYQYKIHCRIAEYYMKQIEEEKLSSRDQPLPDVVTSASASVAEEERRRSIKRMAKSLQQFHTISMKTLEQESSTSGSDSENDDFQFKYKVLSV